MITRISQLGLGGRVVIVAAHPDDEVIGAGMLLASVAEVYIVHTTNGSPRDPADALRSGFRNAEEYAAARREELDCALELAGVAQRNAVSLGFTDQEIVHHLPELCRALAGELARLQPDAILTQPYEGGHPDHDSTAFAVRRSSGGCPLFEMTSYHSCKGNLVTGRFLPNGGSETVGEFAPADILRKERMLACFQSQASVLRDFPVVPERFRAAPQYDFTQPPHEGQLHYERLGWGITGEAWRKLAAVCR